MGEVFDAGSVLVQFKASIDAIHAAVSEGVQALDQFGVGAEAANTKIEHAFEGATSALSDLADTAQRAGSEAEASFQQTAETLQAFASETEAAGRDAETSFNQTAAAFESFTNDVETSSRGVDSTMTETAAALETFTDAVQRAGQRSATAGEQMQTGFGQIDRATVMMTNKLAKATNRLIGLQLVMSSFAQSGQTSMSAFRNVTEAASVGLQTFIAVISAMPGKTGMAIGAIGGLTVAISKFLAPSREATDALEKASDAAVSVNDLLTRLDQLDKDIKTKKEVLGLKPFEVAEERVTAAKSAVEELLRAVKDVPKEIEKADSQLRALTGLAGFLEDPRGLKRAALKAQIESLQRLLNLAPNKLKDLQDFLQGKQNIGGFQRGPGAVLEAQLANALEDARKLGVEFIAQADDMDRMNALTSEAVQLRRKLLEIQERIRTSGGTDRDFEGLKANVEILRVAMFNTGFNALTKELRAQTLELERQVRPLTGLERVELERVQANKDLLKLARSFAAILNETLTDEQLKIKFKGAFDKLEEEFKKRKLAVSQLEFQDTFAVPFTDSLAGGLSEAIIHGGEEGFDALTMIGESFFANMVNSFAKQLQTKAIEALTTAFGAGGAVIGNLLTGIFGVIGLVLARRAGSTQQTFNGPEGVIESSQAVRGVVAGPTNVAIASVGDNLRRAMVGVEARLDALIFLTTQVRDSIRTGGPASGRGFPLAGTVSAA